MRRAAILLGILIFLTGYVNLTEMIKFPALVSHYLTHQMDAPEASFFDFLHDHYCSKHFHCDKHDPHAELPFQHADFHPIVMDEDPSCRITTCGLVMFDECPQNAFYKGPSIASVASDFWQPPKLSYNII